MPQSWRINVQELDRSQTLIPEAGSTGAMVISSRRGPKTPIYVSSRQETRIIDLFGKPSSTYPDVWEAIQYNKTAPIWLASPFDASDTFSGVIVGTDGSVQLASDGPTLSEIDNYSFASDTDYFALFARSPSNEDNFGVKVSYDSSTELFTVIVYYTTDNGVTWTEKGTYTVSPIEGKKDGFGSNVFVENIFDGTNNDFLIAKTNITADFLDPGNSFTNDTNPVLLTGGNRTPSDATSRVSVWDSFQKTRQYKADIFLDNSTEADVLDAFNSLRANYQKYAYYLFAMPDNETVSTAQTTKTAYSLNNAGIALYWNHAKVRDTYNGSYFWTSLIGRVGTKYAEMTDIFNGGAPAWTDENNHGGQLGTGIIEMRYDPTEDELQTLDEAGINAIILDPRYGAMITSQRTGQSPGNLSDNSWVAHRRLFDYILSNIIEKVLPYQLVKLNDEAHRQRVYAQTDSILRPIVDSGLLSEGVPICDRSNNTDEVLAQRKFVLDVIVKVTPYSERVTLRFTHVGQTVDVQQLTQ